jgi:uncharacterized OB-fold protein
MNPETYLEDGDLTHSAWTSALEEDVLLGRECADCGYVTATPKAACTRCGCADAEVITLPTNGEVYTETTVFVPPEAFADTGPFGVGLVDVGGARIMAELEEVTAIGVQVELLETVDEEASPGPLFG